MTVECTALPCHSEQQAGVETVEQCQLAQHAADQQTMLAQCRTVVQAVLAIVLCVSTVC
jgi:CHASE3 domain sensor protein